MQSILIRPALLQDAPEIAAVHIAAWRSAYKGIVPQAYLNVLSYEDRKNMWTDILCRSNTASMRFVAVDEHNSVIGFVAAGKPHDTELDFDAELYAIYLLPEYKGKGVGKQLMLHIVQWLVQNNFHSLYAWVLEDNPSKSFYEKLHARLLDVKKPVEFDGRQLKLIEVVYVWKNLNELLMNLK